MKLNWSVAAIRMFRRTVEWFCCQNKYYSFVEMVELNGIDLFHARTEYVGVLHSPKRQTQRMLQCIVWSCKNAAFGSIRHKSRFLCIHIVTLSIQIQCSATTITRTKGADNTQTQKEEQLIFLSSCWNHNYRWLIFGIKSIKNRFLCEMKRKKAPQRHCGWLLLRHDK